MSAEIIPFPKRPVSSDVVQLLESQLALAKEGKISFVAMALLNDRNVAYSAWTPDEFHSQSHLTSAMGCVSFLSARFGEAVLAGAEEGTPNDAA